MLNKLMAVLYGQEKRYFAKTGYFSIYADTESVNWLIVREFGLFFLIQGLLSPHHRKKMSLISHNRVI